MDFFFFNDTATTEIYTLSLHDALPILGGPTAPEEPGPHPGGRVLLVQHRPGHPQAHDRLARRDQVRDRKSTRLNSSHANISYAVFCLKKNNTQTYIILF